jgi:hypothetical protein
MLNGSPEENRRRRIGNKMWNTSMNLSSPSWNFEILNTGTGRRGC